MVRKKYAGQNSLNEKINELFEYRKLNELLRLGQLDQNKKFIDHLVDIQTQIYQLDAYLESTWNLQEEALHGYWIKIQSSLEALGYNVNEHTDLLKDIRTYEGIEQQCRLDKWPTRISFKKFYRTKSCDVRLLRHLIYTAAPSLSANWKEPIWTYYDLITEINDDIADLEEDLLTYNGNRFLISILRKGIQQTGKSYRKFIQQVTDDAAVYFKKHPKQEQHHELHDWIVKRSAETLELLKSTLHQMNPEQLSSALVLAYMK